MTPKSLIESSFSSEYVLLSCTMWYWVNHELLQKSTGFVQQDHTRSTAARQITMGMTKYRAKDHKGPQRSITHDHRGSAIMRELPDLQQFCLT